MKLMKAAGSTGQVQRLHIEGPQILESHIEGPELGGVLLAQNGGQAGQTPHKPFLVPAENKTPSASHSTASKRRVVEPEPLEPQLSALTELEAEFILVRFRILI
jgi:hypothetical protein